MTEQEIKEKYGNVTDIKNFPWLCMTMKPAVLEVGKRLNKQGKEKDAFALAIAATAMDVITHLAQKGDWPTND